jgi:predicted nucleic acid-binding protein
VNTTTLMAAFELLRVENNDTAQQLANHQRQFERTPLEQYKQRVQLGKLMRRLQQKQLEQTLQMMQYSLQMMQIKYDKFLSANRDIETQDDNDKYKNRTKVAINLILK